jgi:hypothetical protein
MNHYTYFLTASEPYQGMKYYIGVRSCKTNPQEDSYVCSSKIIKRNKINVSKHILATWSSRKEALNHEILLHDCFDVSKNPEFFNQVKQTATGFDTTGMTSPMKGKKHTEESIRKLKISLNGRASSMKGRKHTEEAKQKNSLAKLGKKTKPCSEETKKKIGLANKGRVKSPETREKMSKALTGRTVWNKGLKGGTSWNKGKAWTPEHREAIKLAKLKRKQNESS